MTLPKYRPSLTAIQIEHILALAKTETGGISQISMSLIAVLAPFQAKIQNAGIVPAYIIGDNPAPKQSTLESLGGAPTASEIPTHMDKETYWAGCYAAYKDNPVGCSLSEISAAKEHMYLNDLMTPEEEREHESNI